MTKQQFLEEAIKCAVTDAIKAGATKQQIIEFMKTEEFENRVGGYQKTFKELSKS